MATEFFIMAGDRVIDQVEVSSTDRGFHGIMRDIKRDLSCEAKAAFDVVSEYEMYPEDEDVTTRTPCTDEVASEIERAWFL